MATPTPRDRPTTRRREIRERIRAAREAAARLLDERRREMEQDLERRSHELAEEQPSPAA